MPDTTPVVAVKLRYSPRALWFEPVLGEYAVGDQVLVDTERGREVGRVTSVGIDATPEQLAGLSSPLKPVIRLLDEQDKSQLEHLEEKAEAAMPVFRELVEKSGLEMKPVAIEYLFTGDKAVFYFASENRVDFRELVREMASRLHIRVELRQIGVRDEARMLDGIAHCGERFCCARMGADFQPVSIRMAKEQDLPLNPEKISGACGRLMCCLRYEFEAYKDFKGRAPKRGAEIDTPLGKAVVTDYDTPREVVTMRLEDGKQFSVPLREFDELPESDGDKGERKRPISVSREAMERSANASMLLALSALDRDLLVDELAAAEQSDGRRQRRGRGSSAAGSAGCGGCGGCGTECGGGAGGAGGGGGGQGDAGGQQRGRNQRSRQQAESGEKQQGSGQQRRQRQSGGGQSGGGQSGGGQQRSGQSGGGQQRSGQSSSKQSGSKQSGSRQGESRPADGQQASGDDGSRKSRNRPGRNSSGVRNQPEQAGRQASSRQQRGDGGGGQAGGGQQGGSGQQRSGSADSGGQAASSGQQGSGAQQGGSSDGRRRRRRSTGGGDGQA